MLAWRSVGAWRKIVRRLPAERFCRADSHRDPVPAYGQENAPPAK